MEIIVSAGTESSKPQKEKSSSSKAPSSDKMAKIGGKPDVELTKNDLDAVSGGTTIGSATGGAGAGKAEFSLFNVTKP